LRERVAARRRVGDYPIGLEQELESEFHGMLRAIDRHEVDTSRLAEITQSVTVAAHAMNLDPGTDSRIPGGSAAHQAMSRVVRRHTAPLAESVRDLGVTVAEALQEVVRLVAAQNTADERQLHDAVAGVLDRLAVIDHLTELTADLERRLDVLERERHGS
jgi:ubiquinone biosynthesis protein UbiJ